jgi:hypothetical protein
LPKSRVLVSSAMLTSNSSTKKVMDHVSDSVVMVAPMR